MSKIKLILLLIASSILVFISSCYYDKADLLYPNSSAAECDTTVVSYVSKVAPILSVQCYSCHTTGNPGGGVVLGTYDTDKVAALSGKLSGSIKHAAGYQAMPKGGNKMTTCQIAKIQRWIDAGSPNN